MGFQIALDSHQRLHVSIWGDFDFDLSRDVLIGVKAHWRAGVKDVLIMLKGVTRTNSCAIGTLALLSEMDGCQVVIKTEHCAKEVQHLFASGLLDRYFPSGALAGCSRCLAGLVPACASEVDRQVRIAPAAQAHRAAALCGIGMG